MGIAYSEFDTTPATIVADIKAKILLSADWSNPTGQVVKAVSALGGQHLVVDLADAAATNLLMTLGAYRSHNGVSGTDKLNRYLIWHRTGATAASTDVVHVVVSAGPEQLFISAEGPRGGETNPDTAGTGSFRSTFSLASIVPYYASDTIDTVVCNGLPAASSTKDGQVYVARNAANTLSWVPAILETLSQVNIDTLGQMRQGNRLDMDGNIVLRPWVVNELTAGDRGRMSDIYYAGIQAGTRATVTDPVLAPGQKVTFGGKTFIIHEAGRNVITTNYPLGGWANTPGTGVWTQTAPLLAVPFA